MKKRDIGQEVIESIRELKQGKYARKTIVNVPREIKNIREGMGLGQSESAELICVSKRTLQEWEQGRAKPTGAARRLLLIAKFHPEALAG